MQLGQQFHEGPPHRLLELLSKARDAYSGDDRDKVFALLGIAEAGKYTKVKPDYKKNLVDVYTGLTRQFISEDRNLDVLSAIEDHRFRLERDRKDDQRNSLGSSELPKNKQLPSWVPDWEVHRPSSPFLLHPCFAKWRAAGPSMASCTFSMDHSTLLSYGIAYDTVAYVGDSSLESVPAPGSLFPQSEASNVRFRTKFWSGFGNRLADGTERKTMGADGPQPQNIPHR